MNRRLIISLATAILLIAGTLVAIQFAKGYRPDLKSREIKGTGLLVANSFPEGAQVFINGKLTTATDDTLNLPPADYQIEIRKDGYITWEKTLRIQAELVTLADARLFPAVTDLRPLTFTGATNITPSPDGQKIVFAVSESSEEVNKGLWVLDLVERPLSFSKDPRQIVRNTPNFNFSQAILGWSPDSNQVIAHFPENPEIRGSTETTILLDASTLNKQESLRDLTARLTLVFSQWEEQIARKLNDQLLILPVPMQTIATASAANIYFSPDEEKLLYTATQELEIPENLIQQLPATSTQNQSRKLIPGNIYIYDLKEDKNFLISETATKPAELGSNPSKILVIDKIIPRSLISPESSPSAYTKLQQESTTDSIQAFLAQYSPISVQNIQWYPDSKHVLVTQENKITVVNYDGTNQAVVYSGPFENSFTFPWPDGSKLLILTNLNLESDLPPNLYAINLQ